MALPPWILKEMVLQPKKTGSVFIKILGAVVAVILLLFGIGCELLSAFQGYVIDDKFDARSIPIYDDALSIRKKFFEDLEEQMKEIEEQIIKENTHTVTHEDGSQSEECDVTVSRKINKANIAFILAYVNYADDQIHRWKSTALNERQIMEFLESMTEIRVSDRIDDVYYIWNDLLSAEDIADMYFPDDTLKHEMYLASFDLYVSFLDNYGIVAEESYTYIDGKLQQDASVHETGMSVPQYYQTSYPNIRYGNGTIASSGCGPTCIAMITSYMTGSTVTPADVVKWAGNRYYVAGQGSSWAIYAAAAKNYGYVCSNLGKNKANVIAALEAGRPVIASMGKGTFTKGGHFIVIRGITEDGYFLVNDPNKKNVDKYKTDRFKMEVVFREGKNFWAFG